MNVCVHPQNSGDPAHGNTVPAILQPGAAVLASRPWARPGALAASRRATLRSAQDILRAIPATHLWDLGLGYCFVDQIS